MKRLLWLFLSIAVSNGAYADETTYKWALGHFESGDNFIKGHSIGEVDGVQYLAVITNESPSDTQEPLLVVFRRSEGKYVGLALAKLPLRSSVVTYGVKILNNSIFLDDPFCHHGCSDTRYQFKKVGQQFKLIGIESELETICSYFDEKNAPSNGNCSVFAGNSFNFLTSTTICWMEVLSNGDLPRQPRKLYQPRGVQHKMKTRGDNLLPLDGFDIDNATPQSCYFDLKKKWHKG